MAFVLRERPSGIRPYKQSFLFAAERPAEAYCMICVASHAIVFAATWLLSANAAKSAGFYCSAVMDLSFKICFGMFLYSVVNEKIARSSRGIARKSDILGAETSRQESQVLAVGQTARVLVVLATGLACLPVFHVNLGTVLSFCGMGGLAISVVSKGVFVNLIGSLTIYLTQPFTLGDWIQTLDGEVDGWVQSMGPYHTVVMRWDRRPLYIPNSRFTQVEIINASRMTNRRILMDLPVRLSDLDKIDTILDDIRTLIENHKGVDPEQHRLVRLKSIGPYAAMVWVSCYTKGINLQDWVTVREDVLLSVKNIMFKHGTTFATSLDREIRRSDATGAFLSDNPVTGSDEEELGARGTASGGDEASRKREPLLAPQKALLATELKSLKNKQEALFAREKDLKDAEASLQREQEQLSQLEEDIRALRASIDRRDAELEESLSQITAREEEVQQEEKEVDAQMDVLQAKEDALDQVLRELRAKAGAAQPRGEDGGNADLQDYIEEQQDLLSKEKKSIEKEREILKEQKAERGVTASGPEDAQAGAAALADDAEQIAAADAAQGIKREGEEEAPRLQKIAESLGGE